MKTRRKEKGGSLKGLARSAGSSFILHPSSFWKRAGLALALMMAGAPAHAQIVNDPTRPPAGIEGGAADAVAEAGGMTLQSVMISPTRKAAIISGVMVKLGEKYGDAVLVRVAESEVVLKSGDERQVLKLYPAVEKRAIAPPPAGARARKREMR